MNQLTYPRSAKAIVAHARRTLAAYRVVPGREYYGNADKPHVDKTAPATGSHK